MDGLSGRLSPEHESRIRVEMERLGVTDMAKLLTPALDGVTGDLLFECLWEELGGYKAGQRRIVKVRRMWENRASARGSNAPGTPAAASGND